MGEGAPPAPAAADDEGYARALRESRRQLAVAQRIARLGSWEWDMRADRITWSDQLYSLFGVSPDEFEASYSAFLEFVHPDDRGSLDAAVRSAVANRGDYDAEARIVRRDGVEWIMHAWGKVLVDDRGEPIALAGVAQDATERRRAEKEREELAAQLAQAQRMEAVGQLTGGVAHDFNNLLTVILGNLQMVRRDGLSAEDGARIDQALQASERAGELTRRLLAFSRKQALRPRVVDVNRLVGGLDALLRRTLGEGIEIAIATGGGLWACEVDPAQLESAVLNLAINARDAMPEGGTLSIETRNVPPGEMEAGRGPEAGPGGCVLLAVGDDGEGMTPEVQRRAFEPFFTTKEVGSGSGLGLSMVYGFVKQSGGHVELRSELGQGTRVEMYLPRAAPGAREVRAEAVTSEGTRGNGERILVVEDDRGVRTLTVTMLEQLGYRTLHAADGPEALAVLGRGGDLDLLLTDVVLPGGTTGVRLAELARGQRPGLRVLFMSGYARDAIVRDGRLDPEVDLLEKPFVLADLGRRVREALH